MFTEQPEDFIYNSSIGIHVVSAEGIIVYANECELEVLGYTKDEYIGHHVSEFQRDKHCLSDMMARLGRMEKLKNYPAKVQGKEELKYIIYNSSVYEENGEFKHTRCYGTEVLKTIYDVFFKHFDFSGSADKLLTDNKRLDN
ncbi:PAS domain-containing protein [Colwellia sp. TT2012]|uniref:PAS domain-containing protein n=1 Tax=Colwellia sp. TT2012 TaxID=1720342 RepID=UPI00070A20B2|nr:PAS domain-containing protein [Colwellia sp. TT2012]